MPSFRHPGPGRATARGGTKMEGQMLRFRRFVHTPDEEVYEAQRVRVTIAAHYLWDATWTWPG